jgi:enoyl-CoA hydratase/carnithine racemase
MIASTSAKLQVEQRGHTALLTIDNPAANTWDTESLPALRDLVLASSTRPATSTRWCSPAPAKSSFPPVRT